MIALVVIGIILAYLFVGSVSCAAIERTGAKKCGCSYHDSDCVHRWIAGLAIPGWPIVAVILSGMAIGNISFSNYTRQSRTERRRTSELEEARHRTALAEELAKENAILDRQLTEVRR